MKTPQQLKQWVRSAGGKRVIIRQWSTPEQEEFMRDSPSKRGFDRLHKMLVLCNSAKEIEHIERIIGRSVMTRAISIPHARALVQIAGQCKRQLRERRTIKYWWRGLSDGDQYIVAAGACVIFGLALVACVAMIAIWIKHGL